MNGSLRSARPVTLGSYELLRLVARGGMADVYLARQVAGTNGSARLERHVAVKVLNTTRAQDPEAHALFLDEGRLLAMLSHRNLTSAFEVDHQDDLHYLAMEYVHGADLREVLNQAARAQRTIPYEAAVSIIMAAAAGLDHAHRRCGADGRPLHLVHRDVSLSNIMVGHDGAVKVVDFGIATATVSSVPTPPGLVRGKTSYMSPEQALGQPLDLRTDVFALGIVLYELTTGRKCFPGDTDLERMRAIVRGELVGPSDRVPGYPPGLEAVIKIALATDPTNRFASAAAMIDALRDVSAARGWICSERAIARLMRELFGAAGCPEAAPALTEVTELAIQAASDFTAVVTKPRRFPSGTDAERRITPHPMGDDAPTRGLRPLSWRAAPRRNMRTRSTSNGEPLS